MTARTQRKHNLSTNGKPGKTPSAQNKSRQSLRTTASCSSGEDRKRLSPLRKFRCAKHF